MAARIKITLDKIICNETEDYVGSDEFYVIAAFQKEGADAPKTKREGTWDMNNGQTRAFSPPLVLFDEPVERDSDYLFVITCWDKDAADDVTEEDLRKASAILKGVRQEVGEHLAANDRPVPSTWIEKAIDGLFYLLSLLVSLDKDDFLGKDERPIHTITWIDDWLDPRDNTATNRYQFKCLSDGCDYDVFYTVSVQDN